MSREALELAVISAALAWDRGRGSLRESLMADELVAAINALRAEPLPWEKNEPTGPVERRPWAQIPALWFVQAPGGAWYEVLSTVRDDPMQTVTIGLPNGTDMVTRRSPEVEVPCRAGTLSVPWETLRDGLGAEILKDGS